MLMTTSALSGFKEDTGMWKEGSLKINESVFHYWMKVYEEGSQFGIDGGKVSKLMLKRDGKVIANYDRGWDVMPIDSQAEAALALLMTKYN